MRLSGSAQIVEACADYAAGAMETPCTVEVPEAAGGPGPVVTLMPAIDEALAAAQVLVEGGRWQMLPAYALTALLLSLWGLPNFAAAGVQPGRARLAGVGAALAIGAGGLGWVIAVALPMMVPVFRFPNPVGPHGIGTVTYRWVDSSRAEVFGADMGLAQLRATVGPSYRPGATDTSIKGAHLPNVSAPSDKRLIPYLAADVTFVLDQLAALNLAQPSGIVAGRLDLQRVGALGVSLGASWWANPAASIHA